MRQAPAPNMGCNGQHTGSNEQAASEESARDSANNNRAASGSAAAAADDQCQAAAGHGGKASHSAHQQASGRRPAIGAQGCAAGQHPRCAHTDEFSCCLYREQPVATGCWAVASCNVLGCEDAMSSNSVLLCQGEM